MLKMSLFVVEIVENTYIFFKTITGDVYCCCQRGEDGNGGGDPKGKNTNTTPDPKKMSTLEEACFDICKEKLQMPLQEERNLLVMVFMLP
jgi:hypothetical protein